ncbi:hypothetical protein QN372_08350 [Undibacterium sp. RTI2.1]|uniref:hypothetical protein n=1 Tax=unclassified Undibacterium TaxID=2630295 RepID=UPI002B23894C|nr:MULTISPECIES: hypothetical protein [unclassified Undibacterium]MEB0030753.1 hypothetical protein [Undibacterium sp. RTI2.1]MEB0117128.1 hypothetical protein [Undibacterium sp. RTI2.2]
MISNLPPRVCADALWLIDAKARGGSHWLSNADCQINAITIAGSTQPVSLLRPSEIGSKNSNSNHSSYVSSPRSTWLRYAREEACGQISAKLPASLSQLRAIANTGINCIFSPLAALISASGIDQSAIVGNHLVSTNLYPDWQAQDIAQMTEELIGEYPDRPLMMRNVCSEVTPELASSLRAQSWDLIPARMIYTCDPQLAPLWKRNHVRQDAKLFSDGKLEIVRPEQILTSDLPHLRSLFRQLFIEKYSRLNPDFTPAFFELCQEMRFLDLYGLRFQNRLVGVLGLYENSQSGWITTPLIGYDTSLPQELGLYRRLMALLLQQAKERKLKLHYSSGASQFKRARGGEANLEYTAVYSRHLPAYQKIAIKLLATSLQRLAPQILKKADQL